MDMEIPNLRHLLAFREVCDCKGISAAAARVHLSQPAVTQAIAGLERRLELTLFDRRPDGMFVTAHGEVFLFRVRRFFDHLAAGATQVARASTRRGGRPGAAFHTRVSASQLRALIAIWETGSFSLAARHVGISQPSIHRAARDLERLAGVDFFEPSRRGIALSQAAEAFARAVKLALAELQQGHDEITLIKGRDSTIIRVGSMPLSRTSVLPQAIDAFLHAQDGVQLRATDAPYDELLRGLRYGDLDLLIGALRDPVPSDDIVQEHLFDDPLAIVASARHPLAGPAPVTLDDALAYPWIAPPRSTPTGSYLYRTLAIGARDATPVRIVSSSLVLVRGLLMRGDYVTIMSMHQMAVEREQGLMVPLNIALPDSARPIGITTRKDWRPTPTQARFLDLVRAAARQGKTTAYRQNQ